MAIDTSVPRTRRALLAGGVGGLAAMAASALGRPLPADAGSDGDVVLGTTNTAATTTVIQDTTTIAPAFKGVSTFDHAVVGESAAAIRAGVYGVNTGLASGYGVSGRNATTGATGYLGGNSVGVGIGVAGTSASGIGVRGESTSGHGVSGESTSGYGVSGKSTSGIAVLGSSSSPSKAVVVGRSGGGSTGLLGFSGAGEPPAAPAKTGVYGYAAQDTSARGVTGQTLAGRGVSGLATTGVGTYGYATSGSGVIGSSNAGRGVRGVSSSSTAVEGVSGTGSGVFGRTGSSGQAASAGQSLADGTGVLGYSGGGTLPAAPAKTGVYGYAIQDSSANGVHGRSTTGRGVWGQATSGRGVWGSASSGTGVRGYATSGTGGSFEATSGYALRAVGRVKLDKCAGVATIAAGTKSKTVTPGIDLVSTSAVVATLNGNPGGTTTVQRVAVDTTANTFTVYLTANATANVKVAWHVFG